MAVLGEQLSMVITQPEALDQKGSQRRLPLIWFCVGLFKSLTDKQNWISQSSLYLQKCQVMFPLYSALVCWIQYTCRTVSRAGLTVQERYGATRESPGKGLKEGRGRGIFLLWRKTKRAKTLSLEKTQGEPHLLHCWY